MASGHGPNGPGLQKPTQTIHYYDPVQLLFQHFYCKIKPRAFRECPWPCSSPWGLWPLSMAQMVLASGNQLKPFIIIILHRFCLSNYAEKTNQGPQGSVPWPCSTPWSLWPLGMAQMVLASGNQLKPFTFIIVYNFCLTSLPRKLKGNSEIAFHWDL